MHPKHRILTAMAMSVITGSMTVAAGILHNYGFGPEFWTRWLHTVVVVYPTIFCSIMFIAPNVQRFIVRKVSTTQTPIQSEQATR